MKDIDALSHYFICLLIVLLLFNPFNILKYCLIILCVYILFQLLDVRFINVVFINNKQLLCLVLFCLLYTAAQLIYGFIDLNTVAVYLLCFLTLYILGVSVAVKPRSEQQIAHYLYSIVLGLFLFGITAVVYTKYFYDNSAELRVRALTIPWIEGSQLSATVLGTYVSLGIALLGLIFVKTGALRKALNFSIALLSIYASVSLANRTGLLIGLTSIILVWIVQMKLNKFCDNIRVTGKLVLQFAALFILYSLNFLNAKTYWLGSGAYSRLTKMHLLTDPRIKAWSQALQGVYKNPSGGKQTLLSLKYAHNIWLDVGYTAGIVPFVILIIFTLITIKYYLDIINSSYVSMYSKYLVTTMLSAFLLTFMVEPVMEANYLFFGAFCLFSGILNAITKQNGLRFNDPRKE